MNEKKVKIYSTKTCPNCESAKNWMIENKILFEDVDVSLDTLGADEMIEKSKQFGVPVLLVGDDVVIGFVQIELEKLLLKA